MKKISQDRDPEESEKQPGTAVYAKLAAVAASNAESDKHRKNEQEEMMNYYDITRLDKQSGTGSLVRLGSTTTSNSGDNNNNTGRIQPKSK